MSYDRLPDEERALLREEEHYWRERENRAHEDAREGAYPDGPKRGHGPWWLTALGAGMFTVGVGLPLVRWLGMWQVPACAAPITGEAVQQTLWNLAAWASGVVGYLGLIGLLIWAIIALSATNEARKQQASRQAYGCSLAIAAGFGVNQMMVLAESLACSPAFLAGVARFGAWVLV